MMNFNDGEISIHAPTRGATYLRHCVIQVSGLSEDANRVAFFNEWR